MDRPGVRLNSDAPTTRVVLDGRDAMTQRRGCGLMPTGELDAGHAAGVLFSIQRSREWNGVCAEIP